MTRFESVITVRGWQKRNFLSMVRFHHVFNTLSINTAIAQLGERQTEDLEVTSSILVCGTKILNVFKKKYNIKTRRNYGFRNQNKTTFVRVAQWIRRSASNRKIASSILAVDFLKILIIIIQILYYNNSTKNTIR